MVKVKGGENFQIQNSSLEEQTYLVLFVPCGAQGCLEKYGDYKF